MNMSFEPISLILRGFSLSSQSFYLEKGTLTLPFGKNSENLRGNPRLITSKIYPKFKL